MAQNDTLAEEVARILSLTLGLPVSPGDVVEKDKTLAWDSIKHIEIVMTLEQNLEIDFRPEDIPALTSQAAIMAKIEELNAG